MTSELDVSRDPVKKSDKVINLGDDETRKTIYAPPPICVVIDDGRGCNIENVCYSSSVVVEVQLCVQLWSTRMSTHYPPHTSSTSTN